MSGIEKMAELKNINEQIAETYTSHFGFEDEFINEINDFILTTGKGAKVLDLGCGGGYITNYLQENRIMPIGIDFCDKMLEIAKRTHPGVDYRSMNITDIGDHFDEDSFDGMLSIYTLYFVPRDLMDKTLSSISRLLKPEGKILIVTQEGDGEQYLDEDFLPEGQNKNSLYVNLYKQDELIELLGKHNLIVDSIRKVDNEDPDEIQGDGRLVISAINQKVKKKTL